MEKTGLDIVKERFNVAELVKLEARYDAVNDILSQDSANCDEDTCGELGDIC